MARRLCQIGRRSSGGIRVKPSILPALAAGLLLGACTSAPIQNWPQNQRPPAADEARIIVSGAAPPNCYGIRAFKVAVARPSDYQAATRLAEANLETGPLKSHFADHDGRVNVISLKPGRYWLYPVGDGWALNSGDPQSDDRQTFEFEVAAGELAYVGEMSMASDCGARPGKVGLADHQERDIAVLQALNPAFAGVPVVKRIATPVE